MDNIWKLANILLIVISMHCVSSNEYLEDDEFEQLKNSGNDFAIFLLGKGDGEDMKVKNVLNSINECLQELNVTFELIDCENSELKLCKRPESLNHALLYRDGNVLSVLSIEDLQTPLQTKALFRHHLLLEGIIEIGDKADYDEIQKQFLGESDIIIFYIPALGTEEHLQMIEGASYIQDNVVLCFTKNRELVGDGNLVSYLSCVTAEGDGCSVAFSSPVLSEKILKNIYYQINPITRFSETSNKFEILIPSLLEKGLDVVVLIAGIDKSDAVEELAKKSMSVSSGDTHCVTVHSEELEVGNPFLNSRIQDDKIFLTLYSAKWGATSMVDMMYLQNESPEEFMEMLSIGLDYLQNVGETKDTAGLEGPAIDDELVKYKEDFQDDLLAFTVFQPLSNRRLITYDFKTIQRLTDVTFVEVTQSEKYAVVLFTLEWNARSSATLLSYVDIHLELKEKGSSPLYRVECYNWPDVCQKAGVYTYPRLFFYPAGSTERIEYDGMWDKARMRDSIYRFSLPTIIVVNEPKDLEQYSSITLKTIIGTFETDDGVAEFRQVAEEMKKNYLFIEIHSAAALFAKRKGINFQHRGLFAVENSTLRQEMEIFESKDDIIMFIDERFDTSFKELTVYNFVQVLRDPEPLVIFFKVENQDEKTHSAIMQAMEKLSTSAMFNEKLLFTWMDASAETVGQFVLNTYNSKAHLQNPVLAFFDKKGSVNLKCCTSDSCDEDSLSQWLQDCVEGKVDSSYSLNAEPWKPRLAGYNFLEMMKKEGTYPITKKLPFQKSEESDEDESTETKKSSRGLKLEKLAAQHLKMKQKELDDVSEKKGGQPLKMSAVKHTTHTEL